jgi:hypothetical protein
LGRPRLSGPEMLKNFQHGRDVVQDLNLDESWFDEEPLNFFQGPRLQRSPVRKKRITHAKTDD